MEQIMRINLSAVVKLTLVSITALEQTSIERPHVASSIINVASIASLRLVPTLAI